MRIELPDTEKVEAIYSSALSLNGSYEELYQNKPVGQLPEDSLLYCPLLLAFPSGLKVSILDAGVADYPAMYLQKEGGNSLAARFPHYPKKIVPGSWREYALYAVEREEYLARSAGRRTYPWRLFILAREDKELLENQLAFALSPPSEPGTDHSWVRPGKSTWDWWHDNSLAGLPFEAGMNVAAMTAGQARELEAGLSFLPSGRQYQATLWMDGPNAGRFGEDFLILKETVSSASKKKLSLAPGGGAVMIISPEKK